MWPRKLLFLAVSALALLTYAYANHYQNGFHFDDNVLIENNVSIRNLSNVIEFFSDEPTLSTNPVSRIYRPLTMVAFALDYWRGGSEVANFRVTTFIIYIVLLSFFFALLCNLLSRIPNTFPTSAVALAGVTIYGFHAVNAETINYLSARGSLLSSVFSVAATWLYVRNSWMRRTRVYLVLVVCSILSDASAAVLPLLFFVHHIIFESEDNEPAVRRMKRAALACVPITLGTVASLALVLSLSSSALYVNTSYEFLLTQPYILAHYICAFFLPLKVSAESNLAALSDFASWQAVCGYVLLACLFVLSGISFVTKRGAVIGFGLLWFIFFTLGSSIISTTPAVLDYRRTFIGYAGLSLSLVVSLMFVLERLRQSPRWLPRYWGYCTAALLIFVGAHILATRQRNRVWRNEETLWFDVIEKNSGYGRAYMHYGVSKMERGDFDIARLYLEDALRTLPHSAQLHTDLGTLHGYITKDSSVAEDYFQRALILAPADADANRAYGRWLHSRKRFEASIGSLERAVTLDPHSQLARHDLLDVYMELGRWSKVRETARQILAAQPDDSVARKKLQLAVGMRAESKKPR